MTDGARRRSLWPREHGAYAQLLAPLSTALVVSRPTPAAVLLAIAACAAFLANEPLLVVLGHRGKRLAEQDGARAARRLGGLAVAASVAGGIGLWLAPAAIGIAAIVAVPAAITIGLAWRREERTVVGEIAAAVALSGASAPVLVASGATNRAAFVLWAAWAVGFACTVIAVHRVIARNRTTASWRDAVALAVLGAVAVTTIFFVAHESSIGAAAPLALISTGLVVSPPRARHLRTIGGALVVASVASGALAWAML